MSSNTKSRKIGAFDIRFIIGGLLALYGVILTVGWSYRSRPCRIRRLIRRRQILNTATEPGSEALR